MSLSNYVVLEEDYSRIATTLEKLRAESNSKIVFLLDKNGQQIATAGDLQEIDPTALASLAAGNVAATDGLAKLIGEREFSILFHEGENDSLHICVVGGWAILLVMFDERSSLGLVRLRVKKAAAELGKILNEISTRAETRRSSGFEQSPFAEITDEDIDALFS